MMYPFVAIFVDIFSWLQELNSNSRFDKMVSKIRLKTCNP